MSLQLEIVSSHRRIVGDDAVRVFGEAGGTIGRSLQNDWILPDPDRFISGRHATIDFQGGAYYLADTSTNGVYINGDCEPIGRGNPRRLFNGDNIRMGDFEIAVTVDEGEDLAVPPEPPPSVVPDHIEELVAEDPIKTGMLLLDEEEITGDDEFQSALFGGAVEASAIQDIDDDEPEPPAPRPARRSARRSAPKSVPKTTANPAETSNSATNNTLLAPTDLADCFFDGLGINRAELHPATDLAEVMQNAGEVLREFVEGATKLLASRSNLKSAFHLDQTTVLPRHNNPIKLSADTTNSVKQLLVGKEGEYLGPRDAVREVCRDLLYHQDAFLDAMNSAFVEFADRFDPDELAEGFDRTMGSNPLLGLFQKKKYWQLYCDLYPIMTQTGGGRFPQMFAEEFVKAYEHQIAEQKRVYLEDTHLRETVALNETDRRSKPTSASNSVTVTALRPDSMLEAPQADQAKG